MASVAGRDLDRPSSGVQASDSIASLAPQVSIRWRERVAMSIIEGCEAYRKSEKSEQRETVGFELVCPKRWDQLEATAHEAIRHCGACKTDVLYCTTIEQARTHAQEGGCVALDPAVARSPAGVSSDLARPLMMGRPSPDISRLGTVLGYFSRKRES